MGCHLDAQGSRSSQRQSEGRRGKGGREDGETQSIKKSKADRKGVGTWRTLKCCGLSGCARDCPFDLAVPALNGLDLVTSETPLFPDEEGGFGLVSKIHMVTAWTKYLDSG